MKIESQETNNRAILKKSQSPIKLFHPGLKDLLTLGQYCSRKIKFLSIENPLPTWYKKFTLIIPNYTLGLHLRREYRHLAMGLQGLKALNCDTLFVFEAYNQHLLLLLPCLWLTQKNVLIMLHGNQQFAIQSKIKYWGLLYLKFFLVFCKKFKVLLLEIDDNIFPQQVRLPEYTKIIVPHPIVQELTPSLSLGARIAKDRQIKIGVVGIIRQDKPIGKLIARLQNYVDNNEGVELIVGTPIKQKPQYLDEVNATIRDTTKEKDYFQTLREIDILVTDYDRDRYYYRTSGVISDAGSAGCYILAPDYPVIEHQISYPVKIGDTFTDFTELEAKITDAIATVKQQGQDNHWLWREKRTAKAIADILTKCRD